MDNETDVVVSLEDEHYEIELDTKNDNKDVTNIENEICVICFDPINKNEKYATTTLDGKFAKYCTTCLDEWMKVGGRNVMTTEPMNKYYIFKNDQHVETVMLEKTALLKKIVTQDFDCVGTTIYFMVFVVGISALCIFGYIVYTVVNIIIAVSK